MSIEYSSCKDLFDSLVDLLGYETVAEYLFDYLNPLTLIRALKDLADYHDIDITEV